MEDDEIIVGINKKNNPKKRDIKNPKKSLRKKKMSKARINPKKSKSSNKKFKKNQIIVCLFLILLFLIFLLSSSLFDIKEIIVEGNDYLSDEKIISLSNLELYTNIFNINKTQIKNNIKENAYIEDVEITRSLPSTITISINERTATYMLQFADSYVYINNQGYMLEISNEKLNIPILIGFTTDLSNIKAGNRINEDDLNKMNMVIKIYEYAKSNDLSDLITKIDISDSKNYTIILESEGKTVYLGDCSGSDLNTRMLYLKSILEATKGSSGEVFLNVDLNTQHVYFRKSVE